MKTNLQILSLNGKQNYSETINISKTNSCDVVKKYLLKTIDSFNQFRIIHFVRSTLHYLLLFLNISNTKRRIPAGNTSRHWFVIVSNYLISRS